MIKFSSLSTVFLFLTAFFLLTGQSAEAAKKSVTVGLTLEPPHLDPTAGAAGAIDNIVYHNVFEGLTRINHKGMVLPSLAKAWKISDDGLVYRFFLKSNVTFHNGSSFDANDVIFSFERARAATSTNAQKHLFSSIDLIEAETPLIVRLTLKHPNSRLTYNLAWGDAVIVNEKTAAANKHNPIGTGAFRFAEWRRGQSIVLTRNETYHDVKPKIKQAVFRFLPDPVAAFTGLTSGEVDAFPNFPAPEQLTRLADFPNIKVVTGTTEGETILAINHSRKLLANQDMRLAIAHAINKSEIITGAMFGYGTPIGSHFAPHHPYYVDLTDHTPFNPPLSKLHLKKSGYAGQELQLKLPPPPYARRSGEIVAAQLRAAGIKIEIIPVEWATWLQAVFKAKDYDLTLIAHTEPNDINIYGRNDYYFAYNNPNFRSLMRRVRYAKDEKTVKKFYQQAQTIIADDTVNVFLFQLPKLGVWNKDLRGLWKNSPLQTVDLTGVYWK